MTEGQGHVAFESDGHARTAFFWLPVYMHVAPRINAYIH
jgi:hypothetical protein